MSRRFDKKTVLITGAARGIGFATAELFAGEGANVVIADVSVEAVNEATQQLTVNFGQQIFGIVCDVTNEISVNQMVADVISKFGGVDILINNAGISKWKSPYDCLR